MNERDLTADEIAALDEEYEGDEHPSEHPAMVANDDGYLSDEDVEPLVERR